VDKLVTVKEKYGFLPFSVMKFKNASDKWKEYDKVLHIDLTKRSKDCKYLPSLPYSKFSFDLSDFVIKYWSNEGDLVLDQFMGWGIRGVVANKLKRYYIGYEVSPKMFKHTTEYFTEIEVGNLSIVNRDGCELREVEKWMERYAKEEIDLVFTCPPYWNIEKYESVPNQLSDYKYYPAFLARIKEALWNARRVTKKGGFIVYVVADFRAKGKLHPFHIDLYEQAKSIGLQLWDIVISELLSPFKWTQIGKCDRMKYSSKTHEYIMVFKK